MIRDEVSPYTRSNFALDREVADWGDFQFDQLLINVCLCVDVAYRMMVEDAHKKTDAGR